MIIVSLLGCTYAWCGTPLNLIELEHMYSIDIMNIHKIYISEMKYHFVIGNLKSKMM